MLNMATFIENMTFLDINYVYIISYIIFWIIHVAYFVKSKLNQIY